MVDRVDFCKIRCEPTAERCIRQIQLLARSDQISRTLSKARSVLTLRLGPSWFPNPFLVRESVFTGTKTSGAIVKMNHLDEIGCQWAEATVSGLPEVIFRLVGSSSVLVVGGKKKSFLPRRREHSTYFRCLSAASRSQHG